MKQRQVLAVDTAFFITVFAKGIGGFFEFSSGILAAIASTDTLERVLSPLTHLGVHEVSHISAGAKWFVAANLLLRGGVRLLLAVCLLQERLWAYPVAMAFLLGFAIYQTGLMLSGHFSVALLGLTILDIAVIGLTYYEYQKLKRGGHLQGLHL